MARTTRGAAESITDVSLNLLLNGSTGDIESICSIYLSIYLFYGLKKQKWSVVTLSIRLSSNRSQVRSNQIHFANFFKNSVSTKIVTICLMSCLTDPLTRKQHFHATRQIGKIQSFFYEQVPLFECAQSWNTVGVQRFWICLQMPPTSFMFLCGPCYWRETMVRVTVTW